jgi:chemotaxis protein methyltransferase CheR
MGTVKAEARAVRDSDCTAFLRWVLPQLELSWPGFRKVQRQVCRRVTRRLRHLGLDSHAAYRARLESDPAEWPILDACCHITISRFFRDRSTFDLLRKEVLPDVAARAQGEGRDVHVWSAGCASGEEPYTLKIVWELDVAPSFPTVGARILASDIDEVMLARARDGCFAPTSLRELPSAHAAAAFDQVGSRHCLRPKYRDGIAFLRQDLRCEMPAGPFDLVLCRYLAFTYFAAPLQQKVVAGLLERLRPGGCLVIGRHETLPGDVAGLAAHAAAPKVFLKIPIGERPARRSATEAGGCLP